MHKNNLNPKDENQLANCINTFLILTGVYTKLPPNNVLVNKLYFCYTVFVKVIFICFYFGILIQMIQDIMNGSPLEIIIPNVGIIITLTKVTVQVFIYIKNHVIDMFDGVSIKEKEVWAEDDEEVKKVYLKNIAKGKFFRTVIVCSTVLTAISFSITDSISMIKLKRYNAEHNITVQTNFLFNYWFPADRLRHLNLVLWINFNITYSTIVYKIATNLMTILLCIATSTHLSLLQYRLRTYISNNLTENEMEEAIITLKSIIREHQRIIKFHTSVNAATSNIIMISYVLSSVDVAAGAIEILKTMDGWFFFYTSMMVLDVFCMAWTANEVYIQSYAVGDAAYKGKWYLLNKEGRQLTHTLMLRSMRPLTMTIGPFGPMKLDSFIVIMKLAYSFITLLRN